LIFPVDGKALVAKEKERILDLFPLVSVECYPSYPRAGVIEIFGE